MKKILLAAFVAVASLSANAQVWVSGEVGLGSSKTTWDGHDQSKWNKAVLAPEIGYKFADNIDFAVRLEFGHESDEWTDDEGVKDVTSANRFSINPYIRYTFLKSGNFSAFVDGGFMYGFKHECGVDENKIGWGIAVRPGFAYSLTEKVGLVAHVGNLGWRFEKQDKQKTNQFGLDLDASAITFGAYVNF